MCQNRVLRVFNSLFKGDYFFNRSVDIVTREKYQVRSGLCIKLNLYEETLATVTMLAIHILTSIFTIAGLLVVNAAPVSKTQSIVRF